MWLLKTSRNFFLEWTTFETLVLYFSGDRNIHLNAMDICGTTAFMIARDGGRKDVVKLLLDYSEDRNIVLNPKG